MHGGNIVVGADGPTIIDWGNARVGPAMLDVANIAQQGSANYERYMHTWQEAAGESLDPWLADVGYQWATVQVNTQYLGYAAEARTPDHVAIMIDWRRAALDRLGKALRRQR
jgi:thiamine kinase-like enzyme